MNKSLKEQKVMKLETINIYIDKDKWKKISNLIDEQYLKLFYKICKKKAFNPWNREPHIIKIEFEDQSQFNKKIKTSSTIPPNHITEYAAAGLTFCYLFELEPNIQEIECYDADGEGFDFEYEKNGMSYKIEMSGVNTGKRETFTKRISAKRIKFTDEKFHSPEFIAEDVFIADFSNEIYSYWDTKKTMNYKGKK